MSISWICQILDADKVLERSWSGQNEKNDFDYETLENWQMNFAYIYKLRYKLVPYNTAPWCAARDIWNTWDSPDI